MRIVSLNCNGIRSAARKGFFTWLGEVAADVVCLQETKAWTEQLDPEMFFPQGYRVAYRPAEKKGYSGVALYSRLPPDLVIDRIGWDDFDGEGRYLEMRFGKLSVVSLYLPSGSSGDARQQVKFAILDRLERLLAEWMASDRLYVLCGDWNIAHRPIDLKNWRGNQNNSGFLPEERAWMERLFSGAGWVDAYRHLYPETVSYTWWSNRGQAWLNNTGWRIDYQVISPALASMLRGASVYTEQRFSDHAPLIVDYDRVGMASATGR
jgi:exodeoxyribonuclease III